MWLKEIAPSNELRKWFGHDPRRWAEFKKRYFAELGHRKELVRLIIERAKGGDVVFLYGANDDKCNNAIILKNTLKKQRGNSNNKTYWTVNRRKFFKGGDFMAKDLVCNMNIDEKKATATSMYKGKTYYFCSQACKEKFDKEPEKFIAKDKG